MIKKQWLINMALAMLTLIIAVNAYNVWQEEDKGVVVKTAPGQEKPRVIQNFNPPKHKPERHYSIVSEQNLFSPDRREFKKPAPMPSPLKAQPKEKPEPVKPLEKVEGKKISLFGVILLPGYKAAIVSNPDDDKDKRAQKKVKVGESLGDYKIVDIQDDRILLSKNRERFEIPLFDKDNPKNRRTAKKEAAVKKKTTPKVINTQPDETASDKSKLTPQADDDEWEIVDSPFGKIKRRKRR